MRHFLSATRSSPVQRPPASRSVLCLPPANRHGGLIQLGWPLWRMTRSAAPRPRASLIKTRPRSSTAFLLSASTTRNPSTISPPKVKPFCSRLGGLRFGELSLQLLKRQWSEIIELLENARDRRRGIRIHAQFLALVSLFGERFLLRHHGSYKAGRTGNYEDRQ